MAGSHRNGLATHPAQENWDGSMGADLALDLLFFHLNSSIIETKVVVDNTHLVIDNIP